MGDLVQQRASQIGGRDLVVDSDINHLFADATKVLHRPHGKTILMLQIEAVSFRYRPGIWTGQTVTFVNGTNIVVLADNGLLTGEGPLRLFSTGDLPVELGPNKADGIFTAGANAGEGQTVTIDGKVYEFNATVGVEDGDVHIGALATDSLDNLIAAINDAGGDPTDYASATVAHTTVEAVAGAGDTMEIVAKDGGVAGNAIATVNTWASSSFAAVTLLGGIDVRDYWVIEAGPGTFQLALDRVAALAGEAVEFTDNGSGTNTIQDISVVPTADVSDGQGSLFLPARGDPYQLSAPSVGTLQGLDGSSIASFWWL